MWVSINDRFGKYFQLEQRLKSLLSASGVLFFFIFCGKIKILVLHLILSGPYYILFGIYWFCYLKGTNMKLGTILKHKDVRNHQWQGQGYMKKPAKEKSSLQRT